eukprot:gene7726-12196_t
MDEFNNAIYFVQHGPKIKTSNEQKLQFYAIYKQLKFGDNNTIQPSRFKMIERAKWDKWNSLKGKTQNDSKKLYINLLDSIVSDWREWTKGKEENWIKNLDDKLYDNGLIMFFNTKNMNDTTKDVLKKYNFDQKMSSIEFKNADEFRTFASLKEFKELEEYSILPKQLKSSL